MRLGAHVSTAGSLDQAIDRAQAIGCDCIQIFAGNPRQWKVVRYTKAAKEKFRLKRREAGIDPVVAHSSYLINLASPSWSMRQRSIRALTSTMRVMNELEGQGVVTHIGSALGRPLDRAIERVGDSVCRVLEQTERVELFLENSAGGTLGGSFEELAKILEAAGDHPRIGFCLDTAHLFGAGFDIRTARGVSRMLTELDRQVGLDRLRVFHLNDSKVELGSRRDRHENIGQGTIGETGFAALLQNRRVRHLAGFLETPGFDLQGPDRQNMAILRRLSVRKKVKRRAVVGMTARRGSSKRAR